MYQKRKGVDVVGTAIRYPLHKRGQVTLFIIIGLVLLLALFLLVTLRKETLGITPDEILPVGKGKIEQFISKCIEDAGEEALFRLGQQAGYVTVPDEISNDASRHLRTSNVMVIPYWAYGEFTAIPSIQRIKEEIDTHIEAAVPECLLASPAFREKYDLLEKSPLEADTEIGDTKVLFNAHWEIEVRDKEGKVVADLLDHQGSSPVKLQRVYETSQRIVEEEMRTLKLEDITQDLIALEHPQLPVAGMELGCSRKIWRVDEAKETLQNMLRVNVRKLQIQGAEVIAYPEEFPYYQNHYVWDVGEKSLPPEVRAVFHYDNNFPFLFQVTPAAGNVMSSSSLRGQGLVSLFCLQQWKFTYDVVYPVAVRVTDDTTGYTFTTAFTVHLLRNFPHRAGYVAARPSGMLTFATDELYCRGGRIPMTVLTWENVENEAQGIYQTEPLENVNVSFTCIKYRCDLGESSINFAQRGYQAGLTLNFPQCAGGILRGEKPGYKEDWIQITSKAGGEAELFLTPLFLLPAERIVVREHRLDDLNDLNSIPSTTTVRHEGTALPADTTALIQLTLHKDTDALGQPFHQTSVVYSSSLDQPVLQQEGLSLLAKADFTYELQVDLFRENEFIGGYKGNWTVPWNQLEHAEEIVFHVVTARDASDEELFELQLGLSGESKNVPLPEVR